MTGVTCQLGDRPFRRYGVEGEEGVASWIVRRGRPYCANNPEWVIWARRATDPENPEIPATVAPSCDLSFPGR